MKSLRNISKKALRNFSASQIAAFCGCKRTWFIRWVLGHKAPPKPSQARGVEIHLILENYLKTGRIQPAHEIEPKNYEDRGLGWERYIEWLIPFLPANPHLDPNVVSEFAVFLDTPSGKAIKGYNDGKGTPLVGYVDLGYSGNPITELWDLKTTADLKNAKTPAELNQDIQMNIYARWFFDQNPGVDEVRVILLYVKVESATKKAPKKPRSQKVLPVKTTITRAGNQECWERDCKIMAEMHALAATATDISDVPPTITFCDEYRDGCSQKEICGLSPKDKLITLNKRKPKVSFFDKIKQNKAVQDAAAGIAVPSPIAPSAPVTPAPVAVAPAPAAPAPVEPTGPAPTGFFAARSAAIAPVAVAPAPVAPAPVAPAAPAAPAAPVAPAPVAVAPAPVAVAPVAVAPVAVAPANALTPTDSPPRTTTPERGAEIRGTAQEKLDKKNAKKKEKKPRKKGFALYFFCAPQKGKHQSYTLIEDWMQDPLNSLREKITNFTESRCEDYRQLAYADSKMALASQIKETAEEGNLPTALVVMSGGEGKEIADLLTPFATEVIRAFK